MLRRLADLIRLTLVVGAGIALATGQLEPVLRFVSVLAITLVARWLKVPAPFGLAVTAVLSVEAWGRFFGLYRAWAPFDEVIHFAVMACLTPLVYLLAARAELVPPLAKLEHTAQRVTLPSFTALFGLALGAVWEVYEWATVRFLGSDILTSYGDAITDLVVDALGAVLGGFLLVLWQRRGWPAETTHAARPSRAAGSTGEA